MAIIEHCDGCGRTWRESAGEHAPPGHGHTAWYLLAPIVFGAAVALVIVLLVAQ